MNVSTVDATDYVVTLAGVRSFDTDITVTVTLRLVLTGMLMH